MQESRKRLLIKSFSRQEASDSGAMADLELLLTGLFLRTAKSFCVVPVTSFISRVVMRFSLDHV